MSSERIASLILQLILAIFLIFYGFYLMFKGENVEGVDSDEPFGEYQNLADCIRKNRGKRRDPEQYCRAIREKVRRARRRKYGI